MFLRESESATGAAAGVGGFIVLRYFSYSSFGTRHYLLTFSSSSRLQLVNEVIVEYED